MSTTAALAGTVPAGGAADPATPAAPKDPHLEALGRAEQAARAKHYREAIGICEDVLEASPEHPAALALLGAIHGQRGAIEAGIPLLERACARQAGVANWWVNLSGLYRMQCRMEQALATARRAVQLQANPVSLFNLAKVHMDRGEHDEAATFFLAALARAPDHAEAHLGLGQVLLMRGQMRPGWIEYQWRNATEQAKGMLPKMGAPMWNGMALPNARILLVGDQGYGDTLQFARFIPAVAARVREVLLACSTDLAPLLGRIPGVHACYTSWAGIPGHAAYCRLSSLPGVLGSELDTIPGPHPYLARRARAGGGLARPAGRADRARAVPGRAVLGGAGDPPERHSPLAAARATGAARRGAGRGAGQPRQGTARGRRRGDGADGGARPLRRACGFRRDGGGDRQSRPAGDGGQRGGTPGRRARPPGLDPAGASVGLALAARADRQPVVSVAAAVPPAAAGRVGPGDRGRGGGTCAAGGPARGGDGLTSRGSMRRGQPTPVALPAYRR